MYNKTVNRHQKQHDINVISSSTSIFDPVTAII